jgi:RNA polymerase sigma-70 factor (ECF subfamily)
MTSPGRSDDEEAARNPNLPAEDEILEQLRTGDLSAATASALRTYGPRILGFLWSILREEQAVEEAYGQFCEDLWRGIGGYRGQCSFRTWAFQLAHNAACRYLREPFRRRARHLPTEQLSAIAAEVRDSTAYYRKTTVKDRVFRLRQRLDPEEQALLTLHVDQKLSWREVAQVMSQPDKPLDEATLRKRFERLKRRLRELAEAEGLLRHDDSGT